MLRLKARTTSGRSNKANVLFGGKSHMSFFELGQHAVFVETKQQGLALEQEERFGLEL